jgi:low temperature requirement protein LtrA
MLLGGTALYLLGHTAFKAAIWGRVSWTRIGGVVVLAALGALAPYVPAVILSVCVALVVVAVAAADSLLPAAPRRPPLSRPPDDRCGGQRGYMPPSSEIT